MEESKFICIDIGGTAIKHGVMSESLEFLESGSAATPKSGGPGILETVIRQARIYREAYPDAKAVCMSSTGIIDSDQGLMLESNESLVPHYTGMRITEQVRNAVGLPCFIENDVNCAAMAECVAGAARGYESALMLTIGTGIGGAFVEKGKLLKGYTYSACEVGYLHMRDETGQESTFEELAATSVLVARTARRLDRTEEISGKWIFDQAQAGNSVCREEIDRMCAVLAEGIANLCYVVNPQIVVIGGGISVREDWLRPRLEAGLDRFLIPAVRQKTELGFARFRNHAGMIGACCAAGVLKDSAL
ncbi:MAG: ROK family protein [Eubacteriales bacterium]|nr:ROK family protein [Eubacteriales bacterium]